MIASGMVARSRARYLAPIALVAALGGTYVVVQAGLSSRHRRHHVRSARLSGSRPLAQGNSYVVQPGDSLTSIAAKTGIPLTRLEELNPAADPNALPAGRRLRLRR
jgi:hypothetical protein